MHSLTSRITSCSFWLNLTLLPYSPNLAPCDFFLFPLLKTKLQGMRFETSEAVLKKSEEILKDLTKNGLHHVFEEWRPCKHWAWAMKYLWKNQSQSLLISISKRNDDVLKELHLEPVIKYIQEYQNKWMNHLWQMSTDRIPKATLLTSMKVPLGFFQIF